MTNVPLLDRLSELKRRVLAIASGCSAGWGIVTALAALIVVMWLDLMVDLPPGLRLAGLIVAALVGLVLCGKMLISALRQIAPLELGKRVDQVAGTRGQVMSGIDLSTKAGPQDDPISTGLAQLAIERAAQIAANVSPQRVLPADPLRRVGTALFALSLVIAGVFILWPRLATTQLARFFDPYGDHPPFSRITFDVQPGNTSVVYGGNLEIRATAQGGTVEQLELVFAPEGSSPETLPMFADSSGSWQATITDVTTPAKYFIRARGARTSKFDLGVITVPQIREARFRITPPAYTHRTAYEGPLPQGGIAGLLGTKVEMWLKSNRPLSGGSIQLKPGSTTEMSAPGGGDEAVGSFIISAPGTMTSNVIDSAGQKSTQTLSAPITVLPDERPFVRVLEPRQLSLATPNVTIPVQVSAEDDYGLSRVQLYRGFNEHRARAQDIGVPPNQPVRLAPSEQLDLKEYGLKPGDMVKLYARVEDNDPAGAKGSESPIAVIRIISEEDMQRMQLARQGMEVLQSKYEQAARRMENIQKQIEELLKQLEKLDPNSELAKEMQDQIAKLSENMENEAAAMDKSASQDLPFDIDQAMRQRLKDLAKGMHEMADQTRELSRKPKMSIGSAEGALNELAQKCKGEGEQFKEDTTEPLEHLAKIFPLKEDEARFVELYQRQRELEQRMQSLRSQEKKDDPQTRARMRDLEEEQAAIQQDLRDVLADIDNHVAQLPDDPKLNDLRETAKKFAQEVRASDADPQMASAQSALSDFQPTSAHDSAKRAADTLESFLGKCNGMGEGASTCLKFSPGLSAGLGNTIDQMLAAAMGGAPGMGMGNGGGSSARRSTMNSVGLYGQLPTRGGGGGGNEKGPRGAGADGPGTATDNDTADAIAADRDRTAGQSAGSVPPQYRRRVGEYFRRVADELGEQKR